VAAPPTEVEKTTTVLGGEKRKEKSAHIIFLSLKDVGEGTAIQEESQN